MSSILQVTSLKDVKPFKSGWKVHVKVLHSWKQYNAVHGDTLEIVLSDENSVLSGSLNPNFLIDVIGQVMELGELETIQVAGNPRRKVEFTLRELQITNAFEASLLLINPAIPETVAFKQMILQICLTPSLLLLERHSHLEFQLKKNMFCMDLRLQD
ncbi:hypothetical protein Bca52824_081593 [Brassica carinata]|uniref:Replication protein A 70 kDa DNA-binding subunit B/D first OB fold domain-containing protein n=1 Tax=Brassica carinata TaxID=52824 RepID=A0A8X7PIU9_BRACI|nr:hypothetical protein Bca52824_081593 [Brassica carinata]